MDPRVTRWLGAVALSFAAALCADAVHAQRAEASEAGVKAAFLYKFANYVEWPPAAFASPTAPLVIGVTGSEDVAKELERIVPGRAVNGHPVEVRRMKEGEGPAGVHVLFIGRDHPVMQGVLGAVQGQPILTVTDSPRGFDLGSVVNFVPAGDRLAFEVSLDSAEKSGLRISARMLAVARRVVPRA